MTKYNLYCDESRHTSDISQHFAVIGALQCPRGEKKRIVHRIHSLMAKYKVHGEVGWKRLSPNRREFYFTLLQLFVEEPNLCFRCIVVDRRQLDHQKWNDGDAELGFYKLYYQMLVHWLQPGDTYHIYLDWQQNAASHRFADLRTILQNKLSGRAHVESLEPVTSHSQPLVQLADLLIGAVGYEWNQLGRAENASSVKREFIEQICTSLQRTTLAAQTPKAEQKLNIFNWQGS
ncbi:MAG: DUF3800 domain-containing protein [Puniceicoccales bacterium]